jgi:hypothetical protein
MSSKTARRYAVAPSHRGRIDALTFWCKFGEVPLAPIQVRLGRPRGGTEPLARRVSAAEGKFGRTHSIRGPTPRGLPVPQAGEPLEEQDVSARRLRSEFSTTRPA